MVSPKYPLNWAQAQSLNLVDRDADEGDLPSDRTPDKGWVNTFTYDPSTDQRVIRHLAEIQKRKDKARAEFINNINQGYTEALKSGVGMF